jgi:peptide/nickel transport system ATP-binding protein
MRAGPILELAGVSKDFDALGGLVGRQKTVRAVSDVSLTLDRRELIGLVGESGCGKSTLGRLVAGLLKPSAGRITLEGRARAELSFAQRRQWARDVQMVFQNPYASLNPRQTVRQILEEPLRVHRIVATADIRSRLEQLLEGVGLDSSFANRRPHQLSGGQCQRVGIARALSVEPKILVCDEPVSALDVSIQAQVLNLFADLRERISIACIFISHDLGVVERLSDRVAVMYLGRIVEVANKSALFDVAKHPYTQMLLAAVPKIGRHRKGTVEISGERPSALDPPRGCHFHPRCPRAMKRCREAAPELREVAPGQLAACHLYD